MTDFLFTYKSFTIAQKAVRVLERVGISAAVRRTPQGLSEEGCAYAVAFKGADAKYAASLLKSAGASPVKVFTVGRGGVPERRTV